MNKTLTTTSRRIVRWPASTRRWKPMGRGREGCSARCWPGHWVATSGQDRTRCLTMRAPPRPAPASWSRACPDVRTKTYCWLGRKDSNLQPSDPESAALPLRHSPSHFRSEAGRLILGTCRRPAAYSLVMTTSGFLPDPSERTVIRIDKDSFLPMRRPKVSSISVFAL